MSAYPFEQLAPIAWRCPSNIALIKYWGKYGTQLPQNASLSFTLSAAHTDMHLLATQRNDSKAAAAIISLDFSFEGERNEAFARKICTFLESLLPIFPFLSQLDLQISSSNSFPHSSGIASSASSMGALALCLCSLEQQLAVEANSSVVDASFLQKASLVARLGSGSAARSVWSQAAVWGQHPAIDGSHNEYAVPFALHPYFADYHNTILIVSKAQKAVSSSAGHALMQQHPYALVRYEQANQSLAMLATALQQADTDTMIRITEAEALTLHGLMMNSQPSFILMQPNTLHIIEAVRRFRHDTQLPVCFTLDAGPNVHLLYPQQHAALVQSWIQTELLPYCEDQRFIADRVGEGATRLL